jgi:hypothetical protein
MIIFFRVFIDLQIYDGFLSGEMINFGVSKFVSPKCKVKRHRPK